jgi:proteic killer suppression protein
MIKQFSDAATETVFKGECPKGFPAQIFASAVRKLFMLEQARSLNDLRYPPGNRLHALTGDRKGQHAISINDQYRLCFTWREDGAYGVEITDYH